METQIKTRNQLTLATNNPTKKFITYTPDSNSNPASSLIMSSDSSNATSAFINHTNTFSDQDQVQLQQQYSNFVDLGASLFTSNENDQFYYNQCYMQPANLLAITTPELANNQAKLTTFTLSSPSTNRNIDDFQHNHHQTQQLKYQQTNYLMHQETSFDNDTSQIDTTQLEFENHSASNALTQTSPVTSSWLVQNFEPAEGCSLRRSTLYNYYLHHCTEQSLEPVNPASFGKLIRSVFLGLRTRRLGTRGNSKYHYYGIRVQASSALNHLDEDDVTAIKNHPLSLSPTGSPQKQCKNYDSSPNKRIKLVNSFNYDTQADYKPIISENMPELDKKPILTNITAKTFKQNNNKLNVTTVESQMYESTDDELNKMILNGIIPQLPSLSTICVDSIQLPADCHLDDIKKFEELYKEHIEKQFNLIISLKFSDIENLWNIFWRSPTINQNCYELLSTEKFMHICSIKQVVDFVKQTDYMFYEFCVDILIPDVLAPLKPNLVQPIREFAKSAKNWSINALVNTPDLMKQTKIQTIKSFSMTLKQYTILSHLIQTVRNTFQNESFLNYMSHDLNKVDFNYIKEQSNWVSGCDRMLIDKFEKEFKDSLSSYPTVEVWLNWLDSVACFYLKQYEKCENYSKMAKQFLLKWSFLCSSIIRDLTLRSAKSFGSFHMLHLLFDEYFYYLIGHKLAKELNLKHLEVIGCEDLRCEFSQI